MGHGATLNKVRNIEALFERVAGIFLLKFHPLESMRTAALASTVHDNVYDYTLPSDFGSMIDLIPQDNRTTWDKALRNNAGVFDLEKAIKTKVVSIEGSEGSKIIRINWRSRQGKTLHTMDSVTANGTWEAVNSTENIIADSIFKKTGGASIKFRVVNSGVGIQNDEMQAMDLTDEDEVADVFVPVFLTEIPESLRATWGNDLTTNFWTSAVQTTQADGTAFKVGWNLLKFPWSSATETGAVDPSLIDSFKIIITGSVPGLVRVDNIIFSIGRNFDIKYYSKYMFRNSEGTWISRTSSDDDIVAVDNDTLPMFLFECLKEMAAQMEGTDSAFDINHADDALRVLYPAYTGVYPSQLKKVSAGYGSKRPSRGRW